MSSNESLAAVKPQARNRELIGAGLRRRHASEKRFRFMGLAAVGLSLAFLSFLFISIVGKGYSAFQRTHVQLDIRFDEETIDPSGERDPDVLSGANYAALVRNALKQLFPDVSGRRELRALYKLVSSGANLELRRRVMDNPALIGTTQQIWLTADDEVDMLIKGYIDRDAAESARRFGAQQIAWVDELEKVDRIDMRFNMPFFTSGDSREPEQAGIGGALVGSFLMLIVTVVLSFPIGAAAAVYLEEFAPKNKWTDLIEVNINNLAAVPSIVFGLLGLAVFINFFGLPRSAPLVGGLVLTLMTLPTIIIAGRAALQAVPPSIREAALGVGASKMQMVAHHVLPLALPGLLTGTIIGMARALGETAPLLMIGMVAFIVDVPSSPTDPSTALPVQIYLWADSPERAFVELTSAAIMVLLAFLLVMNGAAVVLRNHFEKRW